MINTLRAAAGLEGAGEETPDAGDKASARPDWVVDAHVARHSTPGRSWREARTRWPVSWPGSTG